MITTQHDNDIAVTRDYWKLSQGSRRSNLVLIQGRRRTTESFWPGIHLTMDGLRRFTSAMHDVTSIVDDYFTNPQRRIEPMFSHSDVLAVCDGPDYIIEMGTSMVGTGLNSIGVTMYGKKNQLLPFVYLVDEEVWNFSADIDELAMKWTQQAPAVA